MKLELFRDKYRACKYHTKTLPNGRLECGKYGGVCHSGNCHSLIEKIEEAKEATQKETGSFKYDFAYEECISIIKNERPTEEEKKKASAYIKRNFGDVIKALSKE